MDPLFNSYCGNYFRTDLEENIKINHHGQEREVKNSKVAEISKENQLATFFDFAFPSGQPGEVGGGGARPAHADLVHNDEIIQDAALKQYYANVRVKDKNQRKIMDGCIMFSRRIKPVIAIIFVIVYWGAGLWRSSQIQ